MNIFSACFFLTNFRLVLQILSPPQTHTYTQSGLLALIFLFVTKFPPSTWLLVLLWPNPKLGPNYCCAAPTLVWSLCCVGNSFMDIFLFRCFTLRLIFTIKTLTLFPSTPSPQKTTATAPGHHQDQAFFNRSTRALFTLLFQAIFTTTPLLNQVSPTFRLPFFFCCCCLQIFQPFFLASPVVSSV